MFHECIKSKVVVSANEVCMRCTWCDGGACMVRMFDVQMFELMYLVGAGLMSVCMSDRCRWGITEATARSFIIYELSVVGRSENSFKKFRKTY